MVLTYLNPTPEEAIDIKPIAATTEVKRVTGLNNIVLKMKTNPLPKIVKRKIAFGNYDEINLLDIFGALNY
jgi:hypothetical protein